MGDSPESLNFKAAKLPVVDLSPMFSDCMALFSRGLAIAWLY
jgi:hypothetical protein